MSALLALRCLHEIAKASNVQNCHLLDHIKSESGYGKDMDWMDIAKHSALIS